MMSSLKKQPIYVSGAPRSGTTWTGKMLALSKEVGYIHEPFNTEHNIGRVPPAVNHRYQYIEKSNEDRFYNVFNGLFSYHFYLKEGLVHCQSLKQAYRKIREWRQFKYYSWRKKRPLVKDPLGIFAIPWLAETFGVIPVILIRRPEALVSSFKRLGWGVDFSPILVQPKLIENIPDSVREELLKAAGGKPDPVNRGSLLWNIIYSTVARYKHEYPEWIFLKHETLADNPVVEFRKLYQQLGLRFSRKIEERIQSVTSGKNQLEAPEGADAMYIQIDSRKSLENWRKRLTIDEIYYIQNATQEVSALFYGMEENQ